jgi:hypothetical protein
MNLPLETRATTRGLSVHLMDRTTTSESKDRERCVAEFRESSRCPARRRRRSLNVDQQAAGEGQELDVNDHYATIIHEERMSAFLREADGSRRADEARGGGIKRQAIVGGLTALAAILASLALSLP